MEIQKIETAEAYVEMTKQFMWLADAELRRVEKDAEKGDVHGVAQRLPGLISIINVVGYFRGQDGFFLDDRPRDVTEKYQSQLYAMEDEVEARLWKLIECVCGTPEGKEAYLAHLRTYYIDARTPKG